MDNRRLVGWLLQPAGRRLVMHIFILLAVIASSILVLLSPLALDYLDSRESVDWGQLSNVGQTYGAASAFLAGLALIGVAASLFLQAKEAKATREQALRMLHGELMKMAMDDPLYRACWGGFFTSDDEDAQRAHMYVNMIINHWLLMWELNSITERHLREISRVVLSGEIGHRFWTAGRKLRMVSAGTERERRFNEILDDEYSKVSKPVNAQSDDGARSLPATSLDRRVIYGATAGVVAVGALVAALARRLVENGHRARNLRR